MIFYTECDRISLVEVPHSELLISVRIGSYGKSLVEDEWGNGWLYESDEYFQTYCMMRYGFKPVVLEDYEFYELINNGITFLSKARAKEFRESLKHLYSLR
jgi:hypothetical protein